MRKQREININRALDKFDNAIGMVENTHHLLTTHSKLQNEKYEEVLKHIAQCWDELYHYKNELIEMLQTSNEKEVEQYDRECNDCGHEWKNEDGVNVCPKCKSEDIFIDENTQCGICMKTYNNCDCAETGRR